MQNSWSLTGAFSRTVPTRASDKMSRHTAKDCICVVHGFVASAAFGWVVIKDTQIFPLSFLSGPCASTLKLTLLNSSVTPITPAHATSSTTSSIDSAAAQLCVISSFQ